MMNEYGVTTKDLAQVIAVFRANPNKELGEVIGG